MKLSIHGPVLFKVFKTFCSSIALFKYDFRTILWQSSQKTKEDTMITKNSFKTIWLCERIFEENWSRNDICIYVL